MPLSEKQNTKATEATIGSFETEEERLRRDVFRSDKEKFLLFTQMLRTNAMYKRAKITHK